jgi:hypothetical protein
MIPRNENDSSLTAKIEAAFREAAIAIIQRAEQTGMPIVVWKDGRVEEVPPEQIPPLPPSIAGTTGLSA